MKSAEWYRNISTNLNFTESLFGDYKKALWINMAVLLGNEWKIEVGYQTAKKQNEQKYKAERWESTGCMWRKALGPAHRAHGQE